MFPWRRRSRCTYRRVPLARSGFSLVRLVSLRLVMCLWHRHRRLRLAASRLRFRRRMTLRSRRLRRCAFRLARTWSLYRAVTLWAGLARRWTLLRARCRCLRRVASALRAATWRFRRSGTWLATRRVRSVLVRSLWRAAFRAVLRLTLAAMCLRWLAAALRSSLAALGLRRSVTGCLFRRGRLLSRAVTVLSVLARRWT